MRTVTLRTTVGGHFDLEPLRKALHEHGPFEPETEYVISINAFKAAASGPTPLRALAEEGTTDTPSPAVRRSSGTRRGDG
jgi:hypothetical protein